MPRRRPRKIITWRYDDGAGTTMEVPVYQVINHDGIWLRVELPELGVLEECSDVNLLRDRVFTAIAERLVIRWAPYLWISAEVTCYDLDDFAGATHRNPHLRLDAAVRVDRIEIGTRPDGSTCHRGLEYGSSVRDGLPTLDDGEDSDTRHEVESLMPDTPENRQALVKLARQFFNVGKEVCARLDRRNVDRLGTDGTIAGLLAPPREGARNTKGDSPCPRQEKR
jgi:hypothetical protein